MQKSSCVEALFTAYLHLVAQGADAGAIRDILIKNNYCSIWNDPVDNRECFSWHLPYKRNDDPLVLECINNIIEYTKENPIGSHFLNKYYTCIGDNKQV